MRISVIGCGYLGAVHAAGMAELGHDVVGIEIDETRLSALRAGRAPFHEPGLEELLGRGLASGRLRFSSEAADVRGATVHFLTVGTPQRVGSDEADLSYLESAVASISPHLSPGDLVVGKSTVPVGTARRLAADVLSAEPTALLAWNPEFLREGRAVEDTLHPDRLVYGVTDEGRARRLLDEVYAVPLAAGTPVVVTDLETAELVKVSANAFLAMKISFINAVSDVCAAVGADVVELADAIGLDARIGRRFLGAGVGFGGGCLPKDIRAFAARADELGAGSISRILAQVDEVNRSRRSMIVELATEQLGGSVEGRRIAVLGLAFKADSDDVRDSPALSVAVQLMIAGADVIAHDPHAIENAQRKVPELPCVASARDAVVGADLVLVLTEWGEYVGIEPHELGTLVAARRVIDGRNCLDGADWRAAGWEYTGIGRRAATASRAEHPAVPLR